MSRAKTPARLPPPAGAPATVAPVVDRIRAFNRFYTRQIGVVSPHHLATPFSLAEVRVLFELAHRDHPSAVDLARDLAIDPGYLSRTLQAFERRGLVRRRAAPQDARVRLLELTPRGRAVFADLNRRAADAIRQIVGPLSEAHRQQIVEAMDAIEGTFGGASDEQAPVTLRAPRPGDLGYVVQRHGVLYAREQGLAAGFEGFIAGQLARFGTRWDPAREAVWIAERQGARLGSAAVTRESAATARLVALIVEPEVRAQGIGRLLLDRALTFSQGAGYRAMIIDVYRAARPPHALLARGGFRKTGERRVVRWGQQVTVERWRRTLAPASPGGTR
ncbi:MAG: MarR family transcriptional regulator [Acidobacteriota bacterium]|nr:MarR family transcriptional regulator [Acidobacteriota bacterium]